MTYIAVALVAELEMMVVPCRRIASDVRFGACRSLNLGYTSDEHVVVFERIGELLREPFAGVTIYEGTSVSPVSWTSLRESIDLDAALVIPSNPNISHRSGAARDASPGARATPALTSTCGCWNTPVGPPCSDITVHDMAS